MEANRPYILVVDDHTDAADSLAELVTLWGYDAEARYDGAAALAAARVRRPAVVLVDVGMPLMSGFDFIPRLRGLPGCGRTAIVVVTGHTSDTHRTLGRDLGIDQYLLKPIDAAQLRARLGRLTGEPVLPFLRGEPGSWETEHPLEPAVAG